MTAIGRHDADAVAACFAADYVDEAPARRGEVVQGREAVRTNFVRLFASVPDLVATILRVVERDNEVWVEWRLAGTRADGSAMEFVGVNIFGVEGGTFSWGRIYTELARDAGGLDAQVKRMTHGGEAGVRARMTSRRVEVDGLGVAYRQLGSGPPLVLLHGFSHDSRAWRPQFDTLSKRFAVTAWDAPGAGRSDDPREPYGIADWAACLSRFLDEIQVNAAHVVGLSWGGFLAQELYRLDPGRVLSLVLADTYAGWTGSLGEAVAEERLFACLRDSTLPSTEFVARYLSGMFSASVPTEVRDELAGIMSEFHPHGFRLMATALARGDTRDLLPLTHVPTLLIWGDQDVRSPITVARQFEDQIPGSQLAVIEGAGHVSNLERPAEFDSAILGFLERFSR